MKAALHALIEAYANGEARGSDMEWEEVDAAFEMACEALGIDPQKISSFATVESDEDDDED